MAEQRSGGLKIRMSAGVNDLIRVARDAAGRVPSEPCGPPYKVRHDSLIAVVFAALSVEGFLNELPELDWVTEGHPSLVALDERLQAMQRLLALGEGAKLPSATKLLLAHEALGRPLDRGASLFQDFYLLKQLRDAVAHPKSDSAYVSGNPVEFSSTRVKLLRALQSRGLLVEDHIKQGLPFLARLSGEAVAPWAVTVASRTVIATLEALPTGVFRMATAAYFWEFLEGHDDKRRSLLGLADGAEV